MNQDPIQSRKREEQDLRRFDINRGFLSGCAVYLPSDERNPARKAASEREIQNKFGEFAGKARIFLDIGAAEGFYSVYMLQNSGAKVFACEAGEESRSSLLRNLEANTSNGHRIHLDDRPVGSDISGEEGSITIDRVAGHEKGPIFLKIDVDGSEAEVLEGAGRVLEREDTRVILHCTSKSSEKDCMWILDEHGFDVSIVGPAWWRNLGRDRKSTETQSRWLVAEKRPFDGLYS